MSLCMNVDVQWSDRKHNCGLPLSFVVYAISRDRLFLSSGFLQQNSREILLHRIRDISVSCSFAQRILGVGTVRVTTLDHEVFLLENICSPHRVKELLFQNVEEQKLARRFRFGGHRFFDPELFACFSDWL